jgi:hypothetical protein
MFAGLVKVLAGGIGGGIAALIISQPKGLREGIERLFCSVFFTVMFGPACCHWVQTYLALPAGVDMDLAVHGTLGMVGWFALHWPINWAAARKDKTPFEIASEVLAKTGSLAAKLGKEKGK